MKNYNVIAILIFVFITLLSAGLNAQCATIHFYRFNSLMQSDKVVYLYQDGELIARMKQGNRYEAEVCTSERFIFSVKMDPNNVSLTKETLKVEPGEDYYFKISCPVTPEIAGMAKRTNSKGNKDLSKGNKFTGAVQQINLKIENNSNKVVNTEPTTSPSLANGKNSKPTPATLDAKPQEKEMEVQLPIKNEEGVVKEMIAAYNNRFDRKGFEHFYVMNSKLYNSKTDKPTAEDVIGGFGKVLSKNRLVVISDFSAYGHHVQLFDSLGKKINSYTIQGFISPNCNYMITLEDADIWRSELNIETGALSSKRRLTELGLFNRRFYHQHWYGDKVVFRPKGGSATVGTQYEINTNSGEITNLHEKFNSPDDFIPISGNDEIMRGDYADKSPDLRFAYADVNYKSGGNHQLGFYDMETGILNINAPSNVHYYWTSNRHIITQEFDGKGNSFIYIRDIPGDKSEMVGKTNAWPRKKREISLNGEYFIYSTQKSLKERTAYVYSVVNDQLEVLEDDGASVMIDLSFQGTYNVLSWISNNELVYVKGGDIIEQGTWYYNAETKTKKRLTSFKASKIVSLKGTPYVYIWANDKFYKFNAVTKEFAQIETENRYISNSFMPIHFERPLYRLKYQ